MIEIKALRERRGGRIGPRKSEKKEKEKGNSEESAN